MIALMCSWIRLARILLSIFSSIFIREIGLKFSFFVGSLCGLLHSILDHCIYLFYNSCILYSFLSLVFGLH
jgi:hypothetical protein